MFDLRTRHSTNRHSQPNLPLDESDQLIRLATRGDPDAIAAVVIGFGPMLLEEAEAALGRSRKHRAPDVVQSFSERLLRGDVSRFTGGRHEGIPFLRSAIRALVSNSRRRSTHASRSR